MVFSNSSVDSPRQHYPILGWIYSVQSPDPSFSPHDLCALLLSLLPHGSLLLQSCCYLHAAWQLWSFLQSRKLDLIFCECDLWGSQRWVSWSHRCYDINFPHIYSGHYEYGNGMAWDIIGLPMTTATISFQLEELVAEPHRLWAGTLLT